jgi:hypothetical protein
MSDVEKFMFLLTSHDLDICKVVILGVSNMYLGFKNLYMFKALNETRNTLTLSRLSDPIY